MGTGFEGMIFNFHTDTLRHHTGLSQAAGNAFRQRKKDLTCFFSGERVPGEGDGISHSFCFFRLELKRTQIDAVGELPHLAAVAFKMGGEKFRVGSGQFSDGMDPQLLQPGGAGAADGIQFSHRKRPHFLWDFFHI